MVGKKKVKPASVVTNYVYNLSYQVLALIVPLITTPYVSRSLQADGIGIYSYAISVVTYFVMFGNIGLATYGQIKISSTRQNLKNCSIAFWEILLLRFVTMALSIFAYLAFIMVNKEYSTLFIILILNLLSSAIDITWFLQGLEKFKEIAVRNFFIKILSVILIFTFVRDKTDLGVYALILNGSAFIGNFFLWPYLKGRIQKVSIKELNYSRHLRASIIYFIPSVATSVYTVLDKSMLGWMVNSSYENGYYEQAQKIETIAVTIVTSLSTVTLSRMTYLFSNNQGKEINSMLNKTVRFVLFISIPMTFGLLGIADNLIPWFLGEGYEKSIVLLKIFSTLIIIVGLNNTIGKQCLMANMKQKQFNFGVILGAICNLILNLIFIPRFASIGAAISSVVAESVILVVFIYYSRELVGVKTLASMSFKYMISGLGMCVLVYSTGRIVTISTVGIIIQILIGIVLYLAILIILKDKFLISLLNKNQK